MANPVDSSSDIPTDASTDGASGADTFQDTLNIMEGTTDTQLQQTLLRQQQAQQDALTPAPERNVATPNQD